VYTYAVNLTREEITVYVLRRMKSKMKTVTLKIKNRGNISENEWLKAMDSAGASARGRGHACRGNPGPPPVGDVDHDTHT
jgi:hypothetical protein